MAIFNSCLATNNYDHSRQDATKLHRICAVCHRWKTVAEGSPVLWRYVSALDPPEHVVKALELSQQMSIAVVYSDLRPRVSEEAFRAMVNPHAARWDQAVMAYDDLDKAEPQVWESYNLSKLHTLEVVSRSSEYTRNSIRLNRGQHLPNLQKAKFVNVPLSLTPGQLPGLRVLELTQCQDPDSGFSIPKLLHLLTGTPQLERLCLLDTDLETDDIAFQGPSTFPALTWLELEDVTLDRVQELLSSIHVPQCDRGDNEVHHQLSEEDPTGPDDVPFDERDYDVLEFQDGSIDLLLGEFRVAISAAFEWSVLDYTEILLERFSDGLASSEHIHAEIEITDRPGAPAITSILNTLDKFANLRSLGLILSSGTAPLLTLIQLLSRPNILPDRVAWHLPHLEFLFITADHPPFLELGEVCWERRKAAELSKCPKAIRELHFSPLDEDLEEEFMSQVDDAIEQELDKLQTKLGRGQIFWGSDPWTGLDNGGGPEATSEISLE